jgi:hypothetical protein
MSKYESLAQFLDKHSPPIWEAEFLDIEAILGFPLPESACRYPAWWANQRGAGHSQTNGWCTVGWRTSKVDLVQKRVTFEREGRTSRALPTAKTQPSDDFAVRGAIEFLIGLGGTMPDYQPAPRH